MTLRNESDSRVRLYVYRRHGWGWRWRAGRGGLHAAVPHLASVWLLWGK